jgi:hypothetical protein
MLDFQCPSNRVEIGSWLPASRERRRQARGLARRVLLKMVEQVRAKLSGREKDQALKLWACAARVFVTSGGSGTVAGHQALVFEDGEYSVPGRHFSRVLNTSSRMKNLTIEADEKGLRIGSFTMSVSGYSPHAQPPGKFQVFPVTDTGVVAQDTRTMQQVPGRRR